MAEIPSGQSSQNGVAFDASFPSIGPRNKPPDVPQGKPLTRERDHHESSQLQTALLESSQSGSGGGAAVTATSAMTETKQQQQPTVRAITTDCADHARRPFRPSLFFLLLSSRTVRRRERSAVPLRSTTSVRSEAENGRKTNAEGNRCRQLLRQQLDDWREIVGLNSAA